MTIFARVYVDEDVDILVATLLLARGLEATTARDQGMLGQPDPERVAILLDTLTADEIANQLLYL